MAQSEYKQEVEKRIKVYEMPDKAIEQLQEWLGKSRRIRFYYETDGDEASYEAKMFRNRRHFSIEFSQDGELQDIEELIRFREIPNQVRRNIDSILTENYDRYTVQRAQRQYLINTEGDSTLTLAQIKNQKNNNYELEVDVKESSRVESYEILFDHNGQIIRQRIIVRRSLDNFLY